MSVRTNLRADTGNLEQARNNGAFPLYPEYDQGAITVWAWGYKLIIDYYDNLDFVDIEKIVVTGHSRGGKTALCGGVYDERIAITAPDSPGMGGTASHRYFELGMNEQTIGHASLVNPHWWTSEYFNRQDLKPGYPFGKAVIAPRAFFNAHALQDYRAIHLEHSLPMKPQKRYIVPERKLCKIRNVSFGDIFIFINSLILRHHRISRK